MSRPKFLKSLEVQGLAPIKHDKDQNPTAVYRCENCRRSKWYKNDWLVPKTLVCIVCGNNVNVKILKPEDYDIIRMMQREREEKMQGQFIRSRQDAEMPE